MAQMQTALGQTSTAAKESSSGFSQLGQAVQGFVLAYAGAKGIQLVGDMIALGDAANRAQTVFTSLTSSMGGYTTNMEALRAATGGIVDDMALQQGATKLLSMGIASTTDEMASLAEMAVKLGSAVGKDATNAMQDFSQMMANNSILRLDNFGISSAAVRAEIARLKDQFGDIDKSEAFKLAVLKVGGEALDRLGAAAQAAETPLNILHTNLQNIAQDFSQNVSTGANSLIGILMYGLGALPQQQQQAAAMATQVQDMTSQIVPMLAQGMELQGDNLNPFADYVRQALTDVANDPSLAGNVQALTAQVFKELGTSADEMAKGGNLSFGSMFDNLNNQQVFEQATAGILQYKNSLEQTTAVQQTTEAAALRGAQLLAALQQRQGREHAVSYYDAYTEFWQNSPAAAEKVLGISPDAARAAAQHAAQMMQDQMIAQGSANQALGSFMFQGQGVEDVKKYETQGYADSVKSTYDNLVDQFKELKSMNEAGLISDAELDKASTLKDRVGEMANEAQRAADAFANMKLADVFGQGSGGMMGQINDMIIAQMKAGGATPEQIQAAQSQMDLASGKETTSSQAMASVAPALAQLATVDPAAATKASQNLTTFFQQAAINGLSQDQIVKGMDAILGVQEGGQKITVKPGDTAYGLASQYGMTPQQILAAAGVKTGAQLMPGTYGAGTSVTPNLTLDPMQLIQQLLTGGQIVGAGTEGKAPSDLSGLGGMAGQIAVGGQNAGVSGMGDNLTKMADNMSTVRDTTQEIDNHLRTAGESMGGIADEIAKLKDIQAIINFTANDPMGIIPILSALAGGTSLGAIVTANGGNVPGTPASTTNTGGKGKTLNNAG